MKRVMCVLGKSPLPDKTGSRRRLLRLTQALDGEFDVRVVIVTAGGLSTEDRAGLEHLEIDTPLMISAERGDPSRSEAHLPRSWRGLDLQAVRRTLAKETRRFEPDVVWFGNQIHAAAVLGAAGHLGAGGVEVPVVVDVAHLERSAIDSQLAADLRGLRRNPRRLRRIALLAADRRARLEAERHAFASSSLLTACSDLEAAAAAPSAGGKVVVIPNGVDLPETTSWTSGTRRLLFVGNLGYPPNAHATRILVEEIVPELRRTHPDVHLSIVGPGSEVVADLVGRPGVTFEGFVPDLDTAYAGTELVVAPIFSGSGTKLKVLEAFAHGVPLVTTPEGIAGLDVTPGEHVLSGASTSELIRQARRVLDDAVEGARLAATGRAWVENGYGWPAIGRSFAEELLAVVNRERSR